MAITSFNGLLTIPKRFIFFLALSRTPHALIDMTNPALAALLCLGHSPPVLVVIVGLVTVFAGYTAVYALNDIVDLRTDKEKVRIGGYDDSETYIDGVMMRHPMAKGALSRTAGLIWAVAWALVALAGAYWLNPVCAYLFLAGCLLEALYCTLWRVTPMRAVINGVVKAMGSIAAVYAVNPTPQLLFLVFLFLWIFTWEIGGQNIPNDWTDIEEDRHFKAKTIPIKLGLKRAGQLSLTLLVGAMLLNIALFRVSPLYFGPAYLVAAVAINLFLLLLPAFRLAQQQDRRYAMELFNKGSFYPLATLVVVIVAMSRIHP